jgi:hypothetical protein
MPSYSPSTQERVGDLIHGLRVETGVFNTATYMLHNGASTGQFEIFKVYGRIQWKHLFIEFITDSGGGAALVQFTYTFTTPSITVKPLSGASGSTAALVRGSRIVCLGGAVSTATGITVATGGASDLAVTPGILGGIGFIGTIGMLTTSASNTSGTAQAVLFYVPMSDGAYVEANALPVVP